MATRSAARWRRSSSTATPDVVEGLVLWASYSAADLSGDGLRVLSTYGTLDQGVPSYTSPDAVAKLGGPAAVTFDPIEGGNHEQMGWYTGQPNDPPATISREAQQERIVASTRALLGRARRRRAVAHGAGAAWST